MIINLIIYLNLSLNTINQHRIHIIMKCETPSFILMAGEGFSITLRRLSRLSFLHYTIVK